MDANAGKLDLKKKFQEHGQKYTAQRQAVFDIMLEHNELHMSSEEIHARLKQMHPGIGVATVYRTLQLFDKMQIIRKTGLEDGFTRYELNDQNQHAHHHLICNSCGNVINMEDDLLDELEEQIYIKMGFTVHNHNLKFYGLCKNCV